MTISRRGILKAAAVTALAGAGLGLTSKAAAAQVQALSAADFKIIAECLRGLGAVTMINDLSTPAKALERALAHAPNPHLTEIQKEYRAGCSVQNLNPCTVFESPKLAMFDEANKMKINLPINGPMLHSLDLPQQRALIGGYYQYASFLHDTLGPELLKDSGMMRDKDIAVLKTVNEKLGFYVNTLNADPDLVTEPKKSPAIMGWSTEIKLNP